MTTTLERPVSTLEVTQARVARAEWTKLRSVRSTAWTLGAAVLLSVGLGALITAVTSSQYDSFSPADKLTFDPITASLAGVTFSQLAIAVLGVLVVTAEHSTGSIRASLTVVPRRLPVLWAKLGVFGGVVLVLATAMSFASFLLGQALLGDLGVSLGDGEALRSVLGASAYLTVIGVLAVAVGSLLRSTAGGIASLVGVLLVLPPLTQLLPSSWTDVVLPYLPSSAGSAMFGGDFGTSDLLSPGAGLAVLGGYVVVLVSAAAWRLRRADV
jgi:hypothetical protein